MVGNPYRWKAVIPQLENRNATAGCMLAVLFLLPFLARTYQVGFVPLAFFIAVYVIIIVPTTTGILSTRTIAKYIRWTSEVNLKHIVMQSRHIVEWLHQLYFTSDGIHVTTQQVVFNMAVEKILCPEQKLSCLYVLLFYTVLAYLQRSLQHRPWTQILHENSASEFIKLTTAFIVVRLGKGVAMSLVLLTFTLQFNHLEPTYTYIIVTLLYFCVTQYQNNKYINCELNNFLKKLELRCLDAMEDEWTPVITHSCPVLMSCIVIVHIITRTDSYIISLFLSYTNIYVPLQIMIENDWNTLSEQREIISKYPLAGWKNPYIRGENQCAVCLDKLRFLSARCTPCGHVFHGSCLRKCLLYSNQCPLCKHQLV